MRPAIFIKRESYYFMSIEQKAADTAVKLITQTLKPSQNEILLASMVKVFAQRHPEEFVHSYQEMIERLGEMNKKREVVNLIPEPSEDFNSLIIKARGLAWQITESLWKAGAGFEHPYQLFEIMRVDPRLKAINDDDMSTISEQTFHGFKHSKGVIQDE